MKKQPGLGFNKFVSHCKANQFAEGCELHFVHDVVPVAFNCARGHPQGGGHFLVTLPVGQQSHNFNFARGERDAR